MSADIQSTTTASPIAVAQPKAALLIVGLALAILYLPTLWRLFNGVWGEEGQATRPNDIGHCCVVNLPCIA